MHDARVFPQKSGNTGKIIVAKTQGRLYVVATPIGNRKDISARAREILAAVTCVAAEDTRHTAAFLHELGIATPLISLHEHNEEGRVQELLERLERGDDIALVSDAGTPLISDPGFRLVRAAHDAGATVCAIPGPSAAIAALSIAGIATDRFIFEGFLPQRARARRARLAALAPETRTLVIYEAPHRLSETLADMVIELGPARQAAIAREMTKMHETLYRDSLAGLADAASRDADIARGEIVIVIAGAVEEPQSDDAAPEALLRVLLTELPLKQAVDLTVKATGAQRKSLYQKALSLKNARSD